MTVELLKEQNRKLRRQLRDTKDALRDAEDTIEWAGKVLQSGSMAGMTEEG